MGVFTKATSGPVDAPVACFFDAVLSSALAPAALRFDMVVYRDGDTAGRGALVQTLASNVMYGGVRASLGRGGRNPLKPKLAQIFHVH